MLKGVYKWKKSSYPGCHEVWSTLEEFFWSFNKGMMWWYNILGDNEGIISYLLRIDTINAGPVIITANLVEPKRKNTDPILAVKRTEWRRSIDYFGLSIEAKPYRVVKENVYFSILSIYQDPNLWDPYSKAPYWKIV